MIKIFNSLIVSLSTFLFSGCANYPTIPMYAPLDTTKVETVYETDFSITKDVHAIYFGLEYVVDKEKNDKEWEKLKKDKAEGKISGSIVDHTTIRKIVGNFYTPMKPGDNGISKPGKKLVLKLEITQMVTQISEPLEAMQYKIGTSQYDIDEKTGDGVFKLIPLNKGEKIEIITDMAFHCSESHGWTNDKFENPVWNKAIAFARLTKGDYHVRIEVLETSPEFKKIRTNFVITNTYFGK